MDPVSAARQIAWCRHAASVSLVMLIALCVAWELFLAPLRPGGSWVVLKALPLLAPLFGILHGRRYTYQWSSMLVLLYFAEGATRGWSDRGTSQVLAWLELTLALVFFLASIRYANLTAPTPASRARPDPPPSP